MSPRTVLAYRALGLGDLLTGLPALRALRGAWPRAHLVLAAPAALGPLAALSGAVDELLPTTAFEPLPELRPDVAVNLHGRGPQSHATLAAARPRRLVAFASAEAAVAGPVWRADEHEVARWCRLLAESGIPADPGELSIPAPPPSRWCSGARRGATIVHPGAASPARRWPVERFASVARAEAGRGRTVLVTGSPEERDLALELARRAGLDPSCVVAGRTDLVELAGIVAAAGRLVCGDTGVAHLATALGTPSVVLFGPTSPGRWGPPPGHSQHRVLWAGRHGDPHGDEVDPGLLDIDVEAVLDELALLDRSSSPGAQEPAAIEG